jgi:hypothetical protein
MRRLHCTRRQVPLDREDDYLLSWASVRRAVEAAGGRAWIFSGAEHEDRFLEFIEWSTTSSPLDDEATALAREQLAWFAAPLSADEWEEAG